MACSDQFRYWGRRYDRVDLEGTALLARPVLGFGGEDDVGGVFGQIPAGMVHLVSLVVLEVDVLCAGLATRPAGWWRRGGGRGSPLVSRFMKWQSRVVWLEGSAAVVLARRVEHRSKVYSASTAGLARRRLPPPRCCHGGHVAEPYRRSGWSL
ncbi:hypothetical protein QYE76_060656 [Lolium multiflorum]|uniref:Uncharacterized protein n=1 Tax=Lolium multiflorum TaxID=4521 RepID=A0AAD8S0I4_LOLMU|nr:hypothetical protein QYE76_060656 [Lolium multiflorum]